ncbi:AAA family ATPase [Nocardia jiangsuensis]|uniref:AAA family ATPase n=1 Tax=Nocardia jiangsuensis TaxID=1691563 RepID=A0ABV8DU81_9NOCA
MRITHVSASNWRNFKNLDFAIRDRLFIVGANAAGKSNLLDLFRFIGDIAGPGGGLASALDRRAGLGKVRSLFARNNQKGRLIIDVRLSDGEEIWRYRLVVKGEAKGKNRPVVDEELVERNGKVLLNRPDAEDENDPERLTQTHLEQISANQSFRPIAEYFTKVRYFHLVPQVIRDPARAVRIDDPFGGDFIAQMNGVPKKTRDAWLNRMQKALQDAVPEFESLKIEVDPTGRPHLVAGYRHWRSTPARHTEADFSDGTLRLIGLLWTLVSAPANGGILLLEEPELSLNAAIVRKLPAVLAMTQRDRALQVVLSTHAPELLDDEGVLPDEILVLEVTTDGTVATLLSDIEATASEVEAGLPTSDIVHELIAPAGELGGLLDVATLRRGSRS